MRWKALGYDEITEKMILAENGRTTPILPKQFFRIWNEEIKPDEWELKSQQRQQRKRT